MREELVQRIVGDLKKEEGFRATVYKDHLGFDTIGYGTLLPLDEKERAMLAHGRGITPRKLPWDNELVLTPLEGEKLLENRFFVIAMEVDKVAKAKKVYLQNLSDDEQCAVYGMGYQMGAPRLDKFRKMWTCLRDGDRPGAADEALDSRWAEQTPARAERMADLLRGEKA